MWEGLFMGFVLGLVLSAGLFAYNIRKHSADEVYVDPKSEEMSEIRSLRLQHYSWLRDGCPPHPVAAEYMDGYGSRMTNYSYNATLVLSNETYHGLFATKVKGWNYTLVIATTGDVFTVNDSGDIQLIRRAP